MSTEKPCAVAAQFTPGSAVAAAPPQVTSQQLLGSGGELIIVHQGRQYRLRVTQNGKLILTA